VSALAWLDQHDAIVATAIIVVLAVWSWADMRRAEAMRDAAKIAQLRRQLNEAWREVDRWKAVAGARRAP